MKIHTEKGYVYPIFTFAEIAEMFIELNRQPNAPLVYVDITFTKDSFKKEYSELSRTYRTSNDNKRFKDGMISNSFYGDCLDGTDQGVRLDYYIGDWTIEKCVFVEHYDMTKV